MYPIYRLHSYIFYYQERDLNRAKRVDVVALTVAHFPLRPPTTKSLGDSGAAAYRDGPRKRDGMINF
jgi:hypothetical protein